MGNKITLQHKELYCKTCKQSKTKYLKVTIIKDGKRVETKRRIYTGCGDNYKNCPYRRVSNDVSDK